MMRTKFLLVITLSFMSLKVATAQPLPSLPSGPQNNIAQQINPTQSSNEMKSLVQNDANSYVSNVPANQLQSDEAIAKSSSADLNSNNTNLDGSAIPNALGIAASVSSPHIEDHDIRIATGVIRENYFLGGDAICRVLNRNISTYNLTCEAEPTLGSIYNLQQLKEAKVNLAIIQSDLQKAAYTDPASMQDKSGQPFSNLRYLFSLHDESLSIIVKKHSPVRSLDDLAHRIVNFGTEGSGVRSIMNMINKIKGWNNNSFSSVASIQVDQQPEALCNGYIDVMLLISGQPSNIIKRVSEMCEIRMISLEGDKDINLFIQKNPSYNFVTIEAGKYSGVPQPITTLGVTATVVTTSELSDEVAYKITKAVFSNLAYFKKLSPVFKELKAEDMYIQGQETPMHAGAARYYREVGLIK